MSAMVKITVNGKEISARRDTPLLKVLLGEGYDVPHLCWHEALTPYAACRLCLVEVEAGGRRRVATSCNYPVMAGMKVFLDTEEVLEQRRNLLETMLAVTPDASGVRELAARHGVHDTILRVQEGKCILCGLCERVCKEIIGANAIGFSGRGGYKELTTPYEAENPNCIGCGSCARVCPTGCIEIFDKGLVREIPYIHARHELVPCSVCGKGTVTRAHARWLAERMKLPEDDFFVCDRCKARKTALSYEAIV
jgi:bidirectional [NiFe] hydrogenase diaphorase subunit